MPYFPFFVNIEEKHFLIVGGGKVAERKIEKLLPFHPHMTIVAPEICKELRSIPCITLLPELYREELLDGMDYVIAATNEREVNRAVAADCRERGIPVNTVDERENCDWIFPALLQRGELCVGISTGGTSPAAAASLRRELDAALPASLGDILAWLDALRPRLKAGIADEDHRARLFQRAYECCREKNRPLTESELQGLMEER